MNDLYNNLSLREKVGQLFFVGIAGPDLDEPTCELMQMIAPGGVCLFSRNIRDAEQTRELNDSIRQISAIPPFISLDQEGGTVDRLRRLITPMAPAGSVRNAQDAGRRAPLDLRAGIGAPLAQPAADRDNAWRSSSALSCDR